ncbi:hypothetical protein BN2475_450114 [Paraburkholderia ribeironis]|uniref:Uncharacterized protein n=1 Tax=Paraburkholderia ribeironis TaxID=1247936 RepID=A0A1N7S911_9BURK|nr:hypothetical protein BN2475_450114 [Paraburkholderia ribeironis]
MLLNLHCYSRGMEKNSERLVSWNEALR